MRHILVCLDCSVMSSEVIPYAIALARSFGAHITLLHVLEYQQQDTCIPTDSFAWEMQKKEARDYLKNIEEKANRTGVSASSVVLEGRPAEQIYHWINEHHVDLTVLSSHGEKGQSQWALASTTQKLIAGMPGSILLVPATRKAQHESPGLKRQRLLVPLDGSSWAESAIPFAINIVKEEQAELMLAHVMPDSGLTHVSPFDSEASALEEQIQQYNERVADHYLSQLKSRLTSTTNIPINTLFIKERGICEQLRTIIDAEAIDMVVMSAFGDGNHMGNYCGKIAQKFLVGCHVPVLLLRGQALNIDTLTGFKDDQLELAMHMPERAAS
ncbi:universal stress protein [Colwelliaceae bacterium 6471]